MRRRRLASHISVYRHACPARPAAGRRYATQRLSGKTGQVHTNVTDERISRVSNYTSTYTSSASRELPGADLSARVDLRYRRFVRAHDQVQVRAGACRCSSRHLGR